MDGVVQTSKSWFVSAALLVALIIYVALSPPGCERTDKEPKRPDGSPKPPTSLLERLRSPWDSEGQADWPVTELLASMSNFAYQTPPAAKTSYGKMGFEVVVPVVVDSMAVFVVSSEDVTVIAFRGTDDPADWLANLNVLSVATPHGEMHKGFADAYRTLKAPILDSLRENPPKRLWVTGHSLGGALAVVCAYDLIDNEKMSLDGVITFGQPMIARKELADYLDTLLLGRFAHVVNDADIVPRIPPTYFHCGSLVWFKDGGIHRSKPKRRGAGAAPEAPLNDQDENPRPLTPTEFEQMKADLKKRNDPQRRADGRPIFHGNTPWIRDHSMSLYLDKVRSLIGHIGEFRSK